MSLRLYGAKISTATQRVMLVLNELDLQFEFVEVDMRTGGHKAPDFVKEKHPFGKLPALEDGALRLFESRAICKYLVAKYGDTDSTLLPPSDAEKLGIFEQMASVEYSYFDPSMFKLAWQKVFKRMVGLGEADVAITRPAETELAQTLDYYDQILATQQYLGSDDISSIDLYHVPWLEFLKLCEMQDQVLSRKNVRAWWTRLEQRPSWQKVLKDTAQ